MRTNANSLDEFIRPGLKRVRVITIALNPVLANGTPQARRLQQPDAYDHYYDHVQNGLDA